MARVKLYLLLVMFVVSLAKSYAMMEDDAPDAITPALSQPEPTTYARISVALPGLPGIVTVLSPLTIFDHSGRTHNIIVRFDRTAEDYGRDWEVSFTFPHAMGDPDADGMVVGEMLLGLPMHFRMDGSLESVAGTADYTPTLDISWHDGGDNSQIHLYFFPTTEQDTDEAPGITCHQQDVATFAPTIADGDSGPSHEELPQSED